jgi:hypothetical protein
VISETIGNAAFDEGIAAWLTDARRRFLKPTGVAVPERVCAMASLVHLPRTYAEADRWREPLAGMDFSPLAGLALTNVQWVELSPASVVTEPAPIISAAFDGSAPLRGTSADVLTGEVRARATKGSLVHGIGVWFRAILVPGIEISNEPPNAAPSWLQGLLPLERPLAVAAGQDVAMRVRVRADGREWSWAVSLLPQ